MTWESALIFVKVKNNEIRPNIESGPNFVKNVYA